MQQTNQRSESQKEALQKKRQHARKIYKSVCKVFQYCVQVGIHVTVELSERCEAWRLPEFQALRNMSGVSEAVAKGCAVNLRNKHSDQLMGKGWRVVTTLPKLAQQMQLRCACPQGFVHSRCEGRDARDSGRYTPEYAKRVVGVLQQELGYTATVLECQGKREQSLRFGEGEVCVCVMKAWGRPWGAHVRAA